MNAPDLLFHTAQSRLLAPYDLHAEQLSQVFGKLMSHQVDYADLYFQYSRSEAWSLEEGEASTSRYRLYLFCGPITPELIEAQWRAFAAT